MRSTQVKKWLETQFPDMKIYNGSIDKNVTTCVGVYTRGNASPFVALGGAASTTIANLPITLLIHWTENSDTCESKAQEIYDKLFCLSDTTMDGVNVRSVQLLDPCPISVGRDDKNIAEMTISLVIVYER